MSWTSQLTGISMESGERIQDLDSECIRRKLSRSPMRGYGEGPHCSQYLNSNGKGHSCVSDNYLCLREESFRRHVGLLWGNGVPLCIEVLLCSDCECGKDKATSGEVSPLPDPAYVLLEQWTVTASTKRGAPESPRSAVGRNLLQAVRSFLHFSQLSAWLSLTKGEEPRYIMYRVTMPGEDFASKFVRTPQDHEFPLANVKNTTIKVLVKSLPRSERIPHILCSNAVCPVRSGKRSPMLSESLLDPSPLPRRFQSPSRESPDHLLFIPRPAIDDRLPTECTTPGKHHCTQDNDEVQNSSGSYSKVRPTNSTRISRRDLFLQSVANRLNPYPQQSPLHVQHQHQQHQRFAPDSSELGSFPLHGGSSKPAESLSSLEQLLSRSNTSSRDVSPVTTSDEDSEMSGKYRSRPIPTLHEKIKFRKFLDSAASMVFHGKTGLPLTSSPAPLRKGQDRFDFDSSLISPAQIKSAINKNQCRPRSSEATQALLGSFEESVLNGRIEPVSTVEGFTAEIGASGSFCPQHLHVPVTVFFYTFCDNDKVSTPYLAHINVGKKGYTVPRKGTVQVTLFNPLRTVIKMFVVMYDLSDMPPDSQTFVRQRILYMPLGESGSHPESQKWLRYLINLRFATSRSGRMFLHTDLRIVIFRKSDADTAMGHSNSAPHELRSFTYIPENPKYSSRFPTAKSSSHHVNNRIEV
ncbi:unnamed protein product [Allacma fusca]|uniref:Atos-like conserved domain-containing protein n=1 Tax=Allacma fusca TaxID=39272 RepID=A0A8J2L6L8_9HEXA|nr:unnamed protein product [Allacma fusca]